MSENNWKPADVKRKRVFNGKSYNIHIWGLDKRAASREADNQRKSGKLARVVNLKKVAGFTMPKGGFWAVYIRYK